MTRGNRFNARGVEDVARRRAQAVEGTPYHATPGEQRWGAVAARPAPEIRFNTTADWTNGTTAINTAQYFTEQMLNQFTIPANIWNEPTRARTPPVREVNLNDLRITPTPPRDPVQERRNEARRQFRERDLTEEGRAENEAIRKRNRDWRAGDRSKNKAKGLAKVLHAAMAMNRDYTGKVFCYKVAGDTGVWSVSNISVAEIDTQTCKIKRLRMPPLGLLPVPYNNLFNKTRFLWRQLGLKAVRYKDTTIVHTGIMGSVLSPGEDWVINPAYVKSFTEHPPKEMTQELLFKDYNEQYATDPGQPRTRPVTWTDYQGRFLYELRNLSDGSFFNLNNPPRDPDGSPEEDNSDSQ